MNELVFRPGTAGDAPALHALISSHQTEGHLLPRSLDEVRQHATHFVVCEVGGGIKACAELAPLSARLAEIRSLVVARDFRRVGVAARLVNELVGRARAAGFEQVCALTHDARFFVRHNFSIVPQFWLPEKIARDCQTCPLFRACGQHAMVLSLREHARPNVRQDYPQRHVAVA